MQHQGRRVHIALLDRVDGKIAKQPKRGHIEKLEECSDKFFVRRILNIEVYFEYRRIDGNRSHLISEKKPGRIFSTMDLTYRRKQIYSAIVLEKAVNSPVHTTKNNRIQFYHHAKPKLVPSRQRHSLPLNYPTNASIAEKFVRLTASVKNLKSLIQKKKMTN